MRARYSSLRFAAVRPWLYGATLALGCCAGPLSAQAPVLLDINGGSGPLTGAEPREFFRAPNGLVYFSACTPEHGCEPWRSDGTEAGTQLLSDIRPGAASSTPFGFGSDASGQLVYFSADDGSHGRELWRTDGSAAGTALVADLLPGLDGSHPASVHPVASNAVVFAAATPALGKELYRTSGSGAQLVLDLLPGVDSGVANNTGGMPDLVGIGGGRVAFAGNRGDSGVEPFVSDGTAAGTQLIRDLVAGSGGSAPFDFVAVASGIAFIARTPADGDELYLSDLTAAGTQRVSQIAAGSSHGARAVMGVNGNSVFLAGSNGSNGVEPYVWNGSAIVQLAEIASGNGSGLTASVARSHSVVAGGFLYFAGDAIGSTGEELWRSNGTAAGTAPVVDLMPGPGDTAPRHLIAVANGAFDGVLFIASGGGSTGLLHRSDGSAAGTFALGVVASADPGTRPVVIGTVGAHKALIGGGDASQPDRELWQSAGSLASTSRVKDIASHTSSSLPSRAIAAGASAYFAAYTAATGFELHATRGTLATTALVTDLRPGPGSALSASDSAAEGVLEGIGLGTRLVFMADTPAAGNELHVSDGTAAGTSLLADLSAGTGGSQAFAFAVAGSRAFVLLGTEVFGGGPNPQTLLVASNGTPAGTSTVTLGCTPDPGGGLQAIGPLVYFLCEDAAFGRELHRIDSTTLATARVTDLATGPDSASIRLLGRIGQPARLLFAEDSGDIRLFASDGTQASTQLIHTATVSQGFDGPAWPDVAGNAWLRGQADGQSAVFRLAAAAPHALSTVFNYTAASAPPDGDLPSIASTGCSLLFKDAVAGDGMELLRVDTSSLSGGVVQPTLQPGSLSSTPDSLLALPEVDAVHAAALTGTSGSSGVELMRLGFRSVVDRVVSFDIAPGAASSSPRQFAMLGKQLLFSAHTAANGRELYVLPAPDLIFSDDFSRGCALPP